MHACTTLSHGHVKINDCSLPWINMIMRRLQRLSIEERLAFDRVYENFLDRTRQLAVDELFELTGMHVSQIVGDCNHHRHNALVILTASHEIQGHFLIGSHKDGSDELG